jgi:L-fucose isomerase-like protein
LKIYIAAANDCPEQTIENAIKSIIKKFKGVNHSDFVNDNPDIIWFLTGGSEHNALKRISAHKRYCFIASNDDNSWASATEVKALLNEKGISTRIFDLKKLDSFSPLADYLNFSGLEKSFKLGLIGKPADWLVASIPDLGLIKEVLNIDITEYTHDELLSAKPATNDSLFEETFKNKSFDTFSETQIITAKLNAVIQSNNLDAVALECFGLLKDKNYTPCLALAALNSVKIPAICEGDLCSAAGMISLFRLNGAIAWMANLIHANREFATFAHCTAPLNLLENYKIDSHFETCKGAAVSGNLKNQQVTIFRIDRKLEYCFLSLGEVVGAEDSDRACRTQAKIKMSIKSLFLLREFPLGNHHLIVPGDHTDILADYFTNKGFRIV